jgi:hypothetical protein
LFGCDTSFVLNGQRLAVENNKPFLYSVGLVNVFGFIGLLVGRKHHRGIMGEIT